MKKVLITGKNSYIGGSFQKWLSSLQDDYIVNTIDMIGDEWKSVSFSDYDAVFHVAAIVHKKEKPDMEQLYNKVNCDLPVAVASKAKAEGVKHFIFMSSMNVYGLLAGSIDLSTKENPKTFYGKSKFEAEKKLSKLVGDDFAVSIIRPPMVYGGKNCPGNYARLMQFVKWIRIYPNYPNGRSMLHIDNLCELVRLIIDKQRGGYFYPQDDSYIGSCDLVNHISGELGFRVLFVKFFNPLIEVLHNKISILNRLFGNLTYSFDMSRYDDMPYCVYKLEKKK